MSQNRQSTRCQQREQSKLWLLSECQQEFRLHSIRDRREGVLGPLLELLPWDWGDGKTGIGTRRIPPRA
jgi:hypothetical protein